VALDKQQEKEQKAGKDGGDLLRGRRQFAFADEVAALPDRWFGYDAVDVVILATGKREYVLELTADAVRHKALQEWVQRGGQLVISVARNQAEVAKLLEKMTVSRLEFTREGAKRVKSLPAVSLFAQLPGHVKPLGFVVEGGKEKEKGIDVATLAPGAAARA